jgi:HK97 family phage portal protein
MAIIRSVGTLQTSARSSTWGSSGSGGAVSSSMGLYGGRSETYALIYKTQPNVRTVVDFVARNVAQLGLHVFRRVSDTDRERLNDHVLNTWIEDPNPATTRYRLIESLMCDLGIHFNAYWAKVRASERLYLVRLPPENMCVVGGLLPDAFVWTSEGGKRQEFAPSEIVHFNGFDPTNPLMGFSPLETLRRILAEEAAAGAYREHYWGNAGRFEGVIERPAAAPKWNATQKADWRSQWQAAFGPGGSRAGQVAILEDGMQLKQASFSAKDSEYLSSRKLTREECAAAYHVPLPMVGILEHATFSNIKEQHKHLYQDCLGPWLEMIVGEVMRQLVPEADDVENVYVEFNIADKMKGSFEEQAASLHALVGRPIMTANEGRARLNLPRIDDPDADRLAPQQGGPGQPAIGPAPPRTALPPAEPDDVAIATIITTARSRQQARLDKLDAEERPVFFAARLPRYSRELADDLRPLLGDEADHYADVANAHTLARLKAEADHAA